MEIELDNNEDAAVFEFELKVIRWFTKDVKRLSSCLLQFIETVRPGYVLIGNDITWEGRLMATLAGFRSVRTGSIQHGLIAREAYNRYHIVDDFFTFSPAFKDKLQGDGLNRSNVLVTGAPYLDSRRVCGDKEINPLIKRRMKLKDQFVLIALSGPGHRTSRENYVLTLSWLDQMIRQNPEVDFVIKLHRKEKLLFYSRFSLMTMGRVVGKEQAKGLPIDIYEWFKGCSCLITGTSMIAYEAMYSGVPVISVDPLKQFAGVDFIDQRAARVVYSYDDLTRALHEVNGKPSDAGAFVKTIFAKTDRSASENIVEQISHFLD